MLNTICENSVSPRTATQSANSIRAKLANRAGHGGIKGTIEAAILACSLLVSVSQPAHAESWEELDRRVKQQVYELNVGLKLRSKEGLLIFLSDLAPRTSYPVFATTTSDPGYRVVGFGSAFPVKTKRHDKTYILTSRHLVESGDNITKECQRFYAGMRLYAEQSGNGNPEARYKQLLDIANLSLKKGIAGKELELYQATMNAVWDSYDRYLSVRVDPGRLLFNKFAKLAQVEGQVGYFLHPPGSISQQALEAKLFKSAQKEAEPDLAVLTVADTRIPVLELEPLTPSEGQEIQVIGYPQASDLIDAESSKYYAPTFSTGRISRMTPHTLQVDAPITNGNSGGPVVNIHGRVLGVVAVRALSANGGELPNFAGAVNAQSVTSFAPDLFGPE